MVGAPMFGGETGLFVSKGLSVALNGLNMFAATPTLLRVGITSGRRWPKYTIDYNST